MERLSDKAIEIINTLHAERLDYDSEYLPLIDCAHRCAAYEDTELEPEEVVQTKLALMGKVLAEIKEFEGVPADRMIELAQAEKDGRLVVLPCKVGDILYEVDLPEYGVITCKAVSISHYNGPMFHVPGNEAVKSLTVEVEVIDGHGKGSSYNFEIEDFGKHVFLTRQEAEEAMRKEEEHG